MAQALASPAFYVGAMGSLKTHQTRSALLMSLGVDADSIARIAAPIGLIPSSRDPEVLALSTLAQIVDRFERG
jgi:xanthine dehydrogenase accessory factor